jgi:hypothetical protein
MDFDPAILRASGSPFFGGVVKTIRMKRRAFLGVFSGR